MPPSGPVRQAVCVSVRVDAPHRCRLCNSAATAGERVRRMVATPRATIAHHLPADPTAHPRPRSQVMPSPIAACPLCPLSLSLLLARHRSIRSITQPRYTRKCESHIDTHTTHKHEHAHTHTHTRTRTSAHRHRHTQTRTRTSRHTHKKTLVNTRIKNTRGNTRTRNTCNLSWQPTQNAHTHALTRTRTHTHTHTHTHKPAHTHTHTHIHKKHTCTQPHTQETHTHAHTHARTHTQTDT